MDTIQWRSCKFENKTQWNKTRERGAILWTPCRHVVGPWISCDQLDWEIWHPHNRWCVCNGLAWRSRHGHIYYLLANKITSIGLDGVESKTNSDTPEPHEGKDGNKKEEKIVPSLVEVFPAFHITSRFITIYTRAHKKTLHWAKLIQSILTLYFVKIHFCIILPSTPLSPKFSLPFRI
jgi:hypothetical protein